MTDKKYVELELDRIEALEVSLKLQKGNKEGYLSALDKETITAHIPKKKSVRQKDKGIIYMPKPIDPNTVFSINLQDTLGVNKLLLIDSEGNLLKELNL